MRNSAPVLLLLLAACSDKESEEPEIVNTAPVADAGADVSATTDAPIDLDGGGSYDPDGDAITYHWGIDSAPEGSSVDETSFPNNYTSTSLTELRADAAGTYVVSLVVKDAAGLESAADFVVVSVEAGDLPIANAGADVSGTEGKPVSLDGSGSYDLLGRDLTYSWTFNEVPSGSALTTLDDGSVLSPTFTPDEGGVYVVSLVVNNGVSDSAPDMTIVDVTDSDPQPPVAVANDDIEDASDCTNVDLDGSASNDPNGDELTYQWSLESKPEDSTVSNDSFSDRTAVETTFWPDISGDYVVALTVFDGSEWATPDLVNLTVGERSYNNAPSVEAGSAITVDAGEALCEEDGYTYDCEECSAQIITLGADASVSDSDGDPFTSSWEVLDDADATISESAALSSSATLSGATPTEPGACEDTAYTFQLSATDCPGDNATDTVTVTLTCCGTKK